MVIDNVSWEVLVTAVWSFTGFLIVKTVDFGQNDHLVSEFNDKKWSLVALAFSDALSILDSACVYVILRQKRSFLVKIDHYRQKSKTVRKPEPFWWSFLDKHQ